MSKNVCSTCKHYERVNDHEQEDHGDCTLYPVWVDVWAAHYCGQWASTGEQQVSAALDIDWHLVPEGYDWGTQDSNGDIYAWAVRPVQTEAEGGYWRWRAEKGKHFFIGCRPWSQTNIGMSLTKRPGT